MWLFIIRIYLLLGCFSHVSIIIDKTKGYAVYVATKGQDPHAIMVPYDFRWPLERICVKDAYKSFNNWATNEITDTDWYKFPELDKVY